MSDETKDEADEPKACPDGQHKIVVIVPLSLWLDVIKSLSICTVCGARCAHIQHIDTNVPLVPGVEKPQ